MNPIEVTTGQEVALIFAVSVAPGQTAKGACDMVAKAVGTMVGVDSLDSFAAPMLQSKILYSSRNGVVSPLSIVPGTKPGDLTRPLIDAATEAMKARHPEAVVSQVSATFINGGTRPVAFWPAWFGQDARVMLLAVGHPAPRSMRLTPEGTDGLKRYLSEQQVINLRMSVLGGSEAIEAIAAVPGATYAAMADVSRAIGAAAQAVGRNAEWALGGLFALGLGWLGLKFYNARRRQ